MYQFEMNGYFWEIVITNPNSYLLIDRTKTRRVATTDFNSRKIYLSEDILTNDYLFFKVLIHELAHCVIFSYDLFDEIHSMVYPEYWIDAEEFLCNFIADYGMIIFNVAKPYLGNKAIDLIPKELERLVA